MSERSRPPAGHAQTIAVRGFRDEDEPSVLELLQRAFGAWPRGLDGVRPAEFFAWKHRASPFGASTLLVAEVDGRPAGMIALMPWRLRFDGRVHETIRGVDLVVEQAYRRRRVSMSLIAAARAHYGPEIALGWSNPNERSRAGVLKSGRRRVSGLALFVGPGSPTRRAVERLAVHGGLATARAEEQASDAGDVLDDGTLLARLLAHDGGGRGRIETAREPEFLRWRYGRLGVYRALVAERHGLLGVAIFRIQRLRRLRVARISELLLERDDGELARRLTRAVRRASGADALTCAFPTHRAAARCGFVRAPQTTTIAANPLRDDLRPDPTSPGSWALSLGDLELI